MPRKPADYRALHAAADSIEPRLARAFERAVARMRERVSINRLAMALGATNAKAALAMLDEATVEDALAPSATIVRDATLRGGRVGADLVNRAVKG